LKQNKHTLKIFYNISVNNVPVKTASDLNQPLFEFTNVVDVCLVHAPVWLTFLHRCLYRTVK